MNYPAINRQFSTQILTWFNHSGRKNLPWQQLDKSKPDPYPVWISEIMLQQTQVATVIDYFHRFMARFDNLQALAQAELEDVLALWAGLGYYARAKNLHKAGRELYAIYQQTGDYPQTTDDWQRISGIGRSTAGAIMAMGLAKFGVICDGNVKRVLTRHFGIDGDIHKAATDKILWQIATELTPIHHSGLYAQAMMDMGATICTRTNPKCAICPIKQSCYAHQTGSQANFPIKAKKTNKPTHSSTALMIQFDEQTLWLKRTHRIWQNLWCLPLMNDKNNSLYDDTILQILTNNHYLDNPLPITTSIRHTLTHFHWNIALSILNINHQTHQALNHHLRQINAQFAWLDQNHMADKPIPTGMAKLLQII